jgi:hypothetical protein
MPSTLARSTPRPPCRPPVNGKSSLSRFARSHQTRRPEATGPAARGRRLIASASRPTEIICISAGFRAPDFPSPFGLHQLDTVDVVAGFGVGGIPDRSRGRGERGAAARRRDQAEPGSLPPDHPAVQARRNEFFGEIERRRRAHSPRFSPALASRSRPGGARAAATLRLQRRPDAVGVAKADG